jgi:hypothetical protein
MALDKKLYLYSYPVQFSTYFITYKYNYQFHVKLKILHATTVKNFKKQFYVQNFLSLSCKTDTNQKGKYSNLGRIEK